MPFRRSCCRWGIGLLITLALTAFFVWISLRSSKPTLAIDEFYVPALNKTASFRINATTGAGELPQNTTIAFVLQFRNSNKDAGIYFDYLNVSLYYEPSHSFVGNVKVDSFYQGHQRTSRKGAAVEAMRGAFWGEAKRAILGGKKAIFRVYLETGARYKVLTWKTRHRTMRFAGDVEVNDAGEQSNNEGVELRSRAAAQDCYLTPAGTLVAAATVLVFLGI